MRWIKNNFKSFSRIFLTVFSIVSMFFEVVICFLDISAYSIKIIVSLILIILIITLFINHLTKKKIKIKISSTTNLSIFFGDLFAMKGNIIIPVSEFYDMVVDEEWVSSKSIHGMFVNKIFGSNVYELESKISKELENIECSYDKLTKKKKYPLGTTIAIEKGGNRFFLVVLSKLNDAKKAYSDIDEYHHTLKKLLEKINDYSQGDAVFMPLIGSGLSNVNMSKKNLIDSLIIEMKGNKNFNVNGGINLVISPTLTEEINLADIKYYHE